MPVSASLSPDAAEFHPPVRVLILAAEERGLRAVAPCGVSPSAACASAPVCPPADGSHRLAGYKKTGDAMKMLHNDTKLIRKTAKEAALERRRVEEVVMTEGSDVRVPAEVECVAATAGGGTVAPTRSRNLTKQSSRERSPHGSHTGERARQPRGHAPTVPLMVDIHSDGEQVEAGGDGGRARAGEAACLLSPDAQLDRLLAEQAARKGVAEATPLALFPAGLLALEDKPPRVRRLCAVHARRPTRPSLVRLTLASSMRGPGARRKRKAGTDVIAYRLVKLAARVVGMAGSWRPGYDCGKEGDDLAAAVVSLHGSGCGLAVGPRRRLRAKCSAVG